MRTMISLLLLLPRGSGGTGTGPSCADPALRGLPFCDARLPFAERAKDLVQRMSLAEKVSNMQTGCGNPSEKGCATNDVYFSTPGLPRLGLPMIKVQECIHGLGSDSNPGYCWADPEGGRRCPTSFPNPINLGCTFNESLWTAAADVVATEGRALMNTDSTFAGGVCWGPVVNLVRDPRWGRASEAPGEGELQPPSHPSLRSLS